MNPDENYIYKFFDACYDLGLFQTGEYIFIVLDDNTSLNLDKWEERSKVSPTKNRKSSTMSKTIKTKKSLHTFLSRMNLSEI